MTNSRWPRPAGDHRVQLRPVAIRLVYGFTRNNTRRFNFSQTTLGRARALPSWVPRPSTTRPSSSSQSASIELVRFTTSPSLMSRSDRNALTGVVDSGVQGHALNTRNSTISPADVQSSAHVSRAQYRPHGQNTANFGHFGLWPKVLDLVP
jgi:hypothetical protein